MPVQPTADGRDRTLIGIRCGMRAMKDLHFSKKNDGYTRSLALLNFGAQLKKQSLDIDPANRAGCRMPEDRFKGLGMTARHHKT